MIDPTGPVHTELSSAISLNSFRDELLQVHQAQPLHDQRQPYVDSLVICDCCCKYPHLSQKVAPKGGILLWPLDQ